MMFVAIYLMVVGLALGLSFYADRQIRKRTPGW
jgi:hypothetical protein